MSTWVDRVEDEHAQLVISITKLRSALDDGVIAISDMQRALMEEQLKAMEVYKSILKKRLTNG